MRYFLFIFFPLPRNNINFDGSLKAQLFNVYVSLHSLKNSSCCLFVESKEKKIRKKPKALLIFYLWNWRVDFCWTRALNEKFYNIIKINNQIVEKLCKIQSFFFSFLFSTNLNNFLLNFLQFSRQLIPIKESHKYRESLLIFLAFHFSTFPPWIVYIIILKIKKPCKWIEKLDAVFFSLSVWWSFFFH